MSTGTLVETVRNTLYAEGADARSEALHARWIAASVRYTPERIVPQWQAFIDRVMAEK